MHLFVYSVLQVLDETRKGHDPNHSQETDLTPELNLCKDRKYTLHS